MLIADVVNALVKKDHVALSECLTDKCRMFDYCPMYIEKENFHIYGSCAVEMFYHNQFVLRGLEAYDPVIDDERTANLYISYGGTIIHAKVMIEKYSPVDGKIMELMIRPA